jgi:hypothetical protein
MALRDGCLCQAINLSWFGLIREIKEMWNKKIFICLMSSRLNTVQQSGQIVAQGFLIRLYIMMIWSLEEV